jgi:3-oxoacyl-[acyl-carrier-protein] synthase II
VSTHLGMFGATSTLSVGHATGAAALVYGAELIRHGHAEALAVTLTDMLTEEVIHAYQVLGLLRAEDGGAGFGLTEASVTIVIERRGDAIARGATILGSVLGTGSASDCTPGRSEQAEAAAVERAIRAAFDDAGIATGDVDNVFSAAAGMTFTDNAETTALGAVFGPAQPKLFEPKKLIGEPIGVGSALTLALSLADPSATGTSLINGTSLGGTHHCLIVSKGDN